MELFSKLDERIKNEIQKYDFVQYKSLFGLLRFHNDNMVIGNCVVFNDADHFSDCGEKILADKWASSAANTWHLRN